MTKTKLVLPLTFKMVVKNYEYSFINFFFKGVAFLFVGIFSNPANATCTASSSPTADCTNLIWTTGDVTNNFTISSSGGVTPAIDARNSAGIFTNNLSGIVSSGQLPDGALLIRTSASPSVYNYGSINGGHSAIYQDIAVTPTLYNSGIIRGDQLAIIAYGQITNLINLGELSATQSTLNYILSFQSSAIISNLTNNGSISSARGIGALGTIETLNNGQGGNSSSASTTSLTYAGNLPSNYNIIINSPNHYGQLSVSSPSGTTTFGIYSGGVSGVAASTLAKGTYSAVLSGITSSDLTGATAGNYNGFTWRLNDSSGNIWDLVVTGSSTADTQQSLVETASALRNTYALQNAVLVNGFNYDCSVFDQKNICLSTGGRYSTTNSGSVNSTSALLIGAYRLSKQIRLGAYIDQNLSSSGNVVNLNNSKPMVGLFGLWAEREDGVGAEVKISAGYGSKDATITRQVVGTSEAGSGSSSLNTTGAQINAKYGFAIIDKTTISPFLGIRYAQNKMNGYTEASNSNVTAPLTYSGLNTDVTTALAGVGIKYQFDPTVALLAIAGVESDLSINNGIYSATGIIGLTAINFNANPAKTRATVSAGAHYDIDKRQRISLTGIYREEAYRSVNTTAVFATYMVGL